jgi:hypothetical protein
MAFQREDAMACEPLRLVAPDVEDRLFRRPVERCAKQQPPGVDARFRDPGSLRLETRSGATRPDLPDRIVRGGHAPAALSVAGVAVPSASVNPLRGFPSPCSVTDPAEPAKARLRGQPPSQQREQNRRGRAGS